MRPQARAARAQDAPALNRLLAQPVGEGLALSYGPAAAWHGRGKQATLAVWQGPQLAGMVSRKVRAGWVNGGKAWVASVGQLRVDQGCSAPLAVLAAGARGLRRLSREGAPAYFLSTLMGDESRMGGLLQSGRLGLPQARLRDRLHTLSLRPQSRRGGTQGLRLGGPWGPLNGFWDAQFRRFQFGPRLAPAGAETWSLWRHGRVLAAAVLRPSKALRIAGLPWAWRWGRPALNAAIAPLLGWPRLPGLGEAVHGVDASLFCAEDDALDPACRLLEGLQHRAWELGAGSLQLCLSEGHALAGPLRRRFGGLNIESRLALLHWPEAEASLRRLDGRPAFIDCSEL